MAAEPPQRLVRILEILPDLGADLDGAVLAEARRMVTAPLLEIEAGPWNPDALAGAPLVRGRPIGVLIVGGLIVREVLLADRVATSLCGPRDIVGLHETADVSLPIEARFSVAVPTELVVFDDRFLAAARHWPRLVGPLLDGAAAQIGRGYAHQAISQLPRVEDRLVALFWHLADRWGHVGTDGIRLDLPLTHEALGRLIGARRPTVSLGLQVLRDRGTLQRRRGGGWLLDAGSLDTLAHDPEGAERLRSVLAGRNGGRGPAARRLDDAQREAMLERLGTLREQFAEQQERVARTLAESREIRGRLAPQSEPERPRLGGPA